MQPEGKVAVVTGASSGIGRATARELARRGVTVCAAARREDRLRELVEELVGGPHSYVVTDVSDRAQVAHLAGHVESAYGRCDLLVNNAGISRGGVFSGPASVESLAEVMATNFFGAVYCTASLLPLLRASAPSGIVNVASIAGRLAVGSPSYAASKFALVGWSECLHHQLAPLGVAVTLVEPGLIPTEGFPQRAYVESRLGRLLLGSEDGVARAIADSMARPKLQRVVPRWYYVLQLPRLLTPPLFRLAQRKLVGRRS